MSTAGKIAVALGVVVSLAHLFLHDPEGGGFLSCPFRVLTGLLCPGCGSQRGLHDLMHLRIADAFSHNQLLVLSIPLLGLQWGWSRWVDPVRPLASRNWVVFSWAALIILFSVWRNLP